jgi:hypothetical protein
MRPFPWRLANAEEVLAFDRLGYPVSFGKRIEHFGGLWSEAVATLNAELKADGRDPIDLHVHDLRRSAHYQMRKAGIDSKTRRAIMGHKTGSMDDRYTVIDDEAFDDAMDKMNAYQKRQGMISELKELAAPGVAVRRRVSALHRSAAEDCAHEVERHCLTLDTPDLSRLPLPLRYPFRFRAGWSGFSLYVNY